MKDDRKNIFNDGRIVETVIMPQEIFRGPPSEKEQWAQNILGDYVSKFHGKGARSHVIGYLNREGRSTGIQATFYEGSKEIIYILMEPKAKNQPGPDGEYRIHIIKTEYARDKEATMVDMEKQMMEASSFSCGLFEAARVKTRNSGE